MRKIKTGIVGLGGLGKTHAFHIANLIPEAELTAACSLVDAELEHARDDLGVRALYKDYDEMIRNADIEAVVIVSPNRFHATQIETALRARKHVFSEKPLGVSVEECKRVEAVVAAHPEQVFTLGFMRRFDKSVAYARMRIDRGDIGQPYLVKTTTIDPAADVQNCIRFARSNPGMLFVGLGIHDIDLLHWFMGCRATSVYAAGGAYANPEFAEFHDPEVGCALYTFENGGMGISHVGRAAPHGYHIETEIVGTEGTIRVSPVPQKNLALLYNREGVVVECVRNYTERFTDAYLAEMQDFFRCIVEGRKPEIVVSDGTIATQMAMATTKAFETHSVVHIAY